MYKIIIVDDEMWAIAGIQTIIDWKAFGFDIIDCCMCGEDAYDSVLKNKPDAILTDIRMPDISGIELMAKLRDQGIDIPVVIISGYSDFQVACEAIKYRAYQYLLKPLEAEKVIEAARGLANILRQKENKASSTSESNSFHSENTMFFSDNSIVADIQKYLSDNYQKDLSLKFLSDKFYLSETYLCDLFKRHSNVTLSSFIRELRLNNACEMIKKGNFSLSQIAETVGYKDYSYFGKLFKNRFKITPEEYRKINANR